MRESRAARWAEQWSIAGLRRRSSHWLICLLAGALLPAQLVAEDAEPPPPPKKPGVRITFLPPPMEGTLSLGIYDKAGKLVRVLAREATEKDFTIGLNGLITNWDGKDEAGGVLPAGSYSARGYSVGAVQVEGVAYHCNDWIFDDESPRIRRVLSVELRNGHLALWAEGTDGKPQFVRADEAGEFTGEIPPDLQRVAPSAGSPPPAEAAREKPAARAVLEEGRVVILGAGEASHPLVLPELTKPLDASLGRDGVWIIDQTADQTEVKEYSLAGEFRRRLGIDPAEPAPKRIFASRTSDLIFLIEERPGLQRVRGLALRASAGDGDPATSTWETVLAKSIIASDEFHTISDKLGRIMPFIPRDKFVAHLLPNPLLREAAGTATVNIGFDAKGSFLQTLDGLPLRRITGTPNLKWAVIGQEGSGKLLSIFQSDGAVVEEFKARKLAQMMSFDAGEYDWPGK
ncbi:MAG: FlgD Ig-like domain [Chthoniobacter sp.]|jgi:hypothetical protein|nr:FlgD Ig-like domain [Chthoniobacter sp.]